MKEGLIKEEEAFEENFWEILPVEKITLSQDIITVDGIENANFLKGELNRENLVDDMIDNYRFITSNEMNAVAELPLNTLREN